VTVAGKFGGARDRLLPGRRGTGTTVRRTWMPAAWCGLLIVTMVPGSVLPAAAAVAEASQPPARLAPSNPPRLKLVAWGVTNFSLDHAPRNAEPSVLVAAGLNFSVSLRRNGVPVVWGDMTSAPAGVGRLRHLAAADEHVVAVRRNGTVVAWTLDETPATDVPAGLRGVRSVATGERHSVALKRDGTVVAWGEYFDWCLPEAGHCEPRPAQAPAGLSGVRAVATGGQHSLALRKDGTVVGWGAEGNSAARVPAGLTDVVAVAAGGSMVPENYDEPYPRDINRDFSAALRRDGTVVTWGDALPAGCTMTGIKAIAANRGLLVAVGRDNSIRTCTRVLRTVPGTRSIAVGESHVLALRRNGRIEAWPLYPDSGDAQGETHVPARVRGLVAIAAGSIHSLGVTRKGAVVAWGSNAWGAATPPEGLSSVVAVAAGFDTSYALRSNGTVAAWGVNLTGQTDVPAGLKDVTAISAGFDHALALRRDGTVVAWGAQCYEEDVCPPTHGAADVPAGLSGVVAVAGGNGFSLALKRDGTVVAWGRDDAGPMVDVPADLRDVKAIAAGDSFSLALRKDGSLVSWGYEPINHAESDLTAITAAPGRAAGIRRDGRVVEWPWNQPERVLPFTDVVAVSVGEWHGLALQRRR
jgi:alpha-tubulin suppressor-like RCC1 family protein